MNLSAMYMGFCLKYVLIECLSIVRFGYTLIFGLCSISLLELSVYDIYRSRDLEN